MTYTPLWTERIEQYRYALAGLDDDQITPEVKSLVDYGALAAERVRENFPDVDRGLLGWVLLDAAAGLNQVVSKTPNIDPRCLLTILMAVGKQLVEPVDRDQSTGGES